MILAICQPNFLPWLGYIAMLDMADTFVVLDDVQYVRREWVNRNYIYNCYQGSRELISVSLSKHSQQTPINRVVVAQNGWQSSVLGKIENAYKQAPYFNKYSSLIHNWLHAESASLASFNVNILMELMYILEIRTDIVLQSTLGITGRKSQLIINICNELKPDLYLANSGSRAYGLHEDLEKASIPYQYQDYKHPAFTCRSAVGEYSESYLSIIDALMYYDTRSRQIVRGQV